MRLSPAGATAFGNRTDEATVGSADPWDGIGSLHWTVAVEPEASTLISETTMVMLAMFVPVTGLVPEVGATTG